MVCELSVNLNAVALLRNRRNLPWPNVVDLGRIALDAGAIGLTVHPRPDQRHTRTSDVHELSALLNLPDYADKEFNLEGYPEERFLALCEAVKPEQVTFVPDLPGQETSDHGWDVQPNEELLIKSIERMKKFGARVALFIDADDRVPELVKKVGADRVELYTGPYGGSPIESTRAKTALEALANAAVAAESVGLGVNAGHDLTVANVPALVDTAPQIVEMSIGHGLTADALTYGMDGSVKRFIAAMQDELPLFDEDDLF